MSEDNALIKTDELGVQKYADDDFDKVASGGFMPRIQLMTSRSKACEAGDFPINHYALVKGKTPVDLGEDVDCLVIAWRPKAIRMDEDFLAVYDPQDEEFKKIAAASSEPNSGCMYGPEFLVYLPEEEEYTTFFLGSKSARNEAPNLKSQIGKAATLSSQKIQTKKFTWFAPKVTQCSSPFTVPDMESIKEAADKFNNPPANEVETVDEGEERAR